MSDNRDNPSLSERSVKNPTYCTSHQPRKVQAAALSVVSNSVLTLLKLLIGFWSGSVSILSEAVHSGTDLVLSLIHI